MAAETGFVAAGKGPLQAPKDVIFLLSRGNETIHGKEEMEVCCRSRRRWVWRRTEVFSPALDEQLTQKKEQLTHFRSFHCTKKYNHILLSCERCTATVGMFSLIESRTDPSNVVEQGLGWLSTPG